jgi:hypothetical protein
LGIILLKVDIGDKLSWRSEEVAVESLLKGAV